MSDQQAERTMDARIRSAFRNLGGQHGTCPTAQELLEASETVRAHVLLCASCSLAMEKVEELRAGYGKRHSWARAAIAAIIVLLLIPTTLVFLRKPVVVEVPGPVRVEVGPPMMEARSFDVSTRRGSGNLVVTGSEAVFLLSVFAPLRGDRSYEATILRVSGEVVARVPDVTGDKSTGNLQLALRREAFPAGNYVLKIADKGTTRETFEFAVEVR